MSIKSSKKKPTQLVKVHKVSSFLLATDQPTISRHFKTPGMTKPTVGPRLSLHVPRLMTFCSPQAHPRLQCWERACERPLPRIPDTGLLKPMRFPGW